MIAGLDQPKPRLLDEREDDPAEPGRAEGRADDVDAAAGHPWRSRNGRENEHHRRHDQRDVEREHPAPRDPVDDHAAGERADDRCDPAATRSSGRSPGLAPSP